ncbi:peptidoglycan-binding protein [Acinetobacter sp. C15]|uniref:LysM peptidoglycan-binding domain-containing protein n=1 Tax=Acinetobacter sp. C15 TaxID=1661746 RepID=UPI0006ABE92E|nr:LysM peptidoglycan-binding domain-containing protein [Acinetobacter sp. C15]KOR14876.1 peptidoglycan-binding protein [Acinetobacter sp. C15]
MSKKSLVTIQILDLFGRPISKAQYEVKNQRTGQVIAAGVTNSSGCIVEISRDKGTTLDVYIKSMFNGLMVKVQSFVMSKDRMLVKITSPKVMLDLKTLTNQGNSGQYKRKTHVVKKGETLFEIAQKNHTTVRALERLNKIDDPNKISIGQVIKLPVNIPANGNHTHQDKSKPATQQKSQPSASTKSKPSQTPPTKPSNTTPQIEQEQEAFGTNLGSKILDQVNELYEEAKKKLNETTNSTSKILTVDDRSQDGGTPKADASNLCKTNPQCISSGKSELIREVNIRLAGFGGALPTDEFTDLTAKCIKQFQRDYMGVLETGKICGSVLVALDKFYEEYPIEGFMGKAACNCGKCTGFGNGNMGEKSGLFKANEYPGLHRSLIWILKAINFYLKNEFKKNKIEVGYIESGYRCIENNKKHGRTTVNHMGLALDIHFNKNGKRTKDVEDMEFIRKEILTKKMSATEQRNLNKIYLEPKVFKNGDSGAVTWVHFDVTGFSIEYINHIFFKKTVSDLNGGKILNIVNKVNKCSLFSCAGAIANTDNISLLKLSNELILSNEDIIDIMKVTETEVIKFKTEKFFYEQAAGVFDTILNRTKSEVWGDSVRSVVNAYRQFSKITGPKNLKPYGSVQNMPFSHVSVRIKEFVNSYLLERSKGKQSIIGGNLNYANKYHSDAYNRKMWVDEFHEQAVKSGLVFGNGNAVHAHGTVKELKSKMPKPFKVVLPFDFKGI